MIKTTGKKNRKTLITTVLLVIAAIVLLSRPGILREAKERASGENYANEKKTAPAAPDTKAAQLPDKARAKLAIIIDDVGYPSPFIDEYRKFDGKLTFSILPFQHESASYARMLYHAGFEIMIHIPMEPEDYPEKEPGEGALFVSDSRDEVEQKLIKMVHNIPQASGANNHMGSMATQDHTLMIHTLSYLKAEGLYFIDSLTTPHSTAYDIAHQLQLQTGNRNKLHDNHNNSIYIDKQFEKLKSAARERGKAIGIGHIQNKYLLSVLNRQITTLYEEGFELVFVSEVIGN